MRLVGPRRGYFGLVRAGGGPASRRARRWPRSDARSIAVTMLSWPGTGLRRPARSAAAMTRRPEGLWGKNEENPGKTSLSKTTVSGPAIFPYGSMF